jgi:hypothetical protein
MRASLAVRLFDSYVMTVLGDRTKVHISDRSCEIHGQMYAVHLPGGDLAYICFDEEDLLRVEFVLPDGVVRINVRDEVGPEREQRLMAYLNQQGL